MSAVARSEADSMLASHRLGTAIHLPLGIDNERFAGLLLRLRGRTGLTQRVLAARLGTHVRSIQCWEAGDTHPNVKHLQGLIETVLDAGGFDQGAEQSEAQALWYAATAESTRLKAHFDEPWFNGLLQRRASRSVATLASPAAASSGRRHWGDAPALDDLLGRASEHATVRNWMLDDACRVVALLGLAGTGKTLLAAHVAHDVAPYFEHVYWRSLRNRLPFSEWLSTAISHLAPQDATLLKSQATQLDRLLELLREVPTLLILDNFETVLQPWDAAGGYQPDAAGYGEMLRCVAESSHRSCLMLTSREEPVELGVFSRTAKPVRLLRLDGMRTEDARELLERAGLWADSAAWEALVTRYGGIGLALKMIGASIYELFAGDVRAYLTDMETNQSALAGGVRNLLDSQLQRLSAVEHEVMRWLAVEPEPVRVVELAADLAPVAGRGAVHQAVEALQRRSLIERRLPGPTFTLQAVVLECVTEQLVELVTRGIVDHRPNGQLCQPWIAPPQERLLALVQRLATLRSAQASRLRCGAHVIHRGQPVGNGTCRSE